MVFSSPVFLFLFLPVLLALYFVTPRCLRNALLLLASLLFYAWGEGIYLFVMLGSCWFNYLLVLAAEPLRARGWQRPVMALAVAANLAVLVSLKYANFLVDNLNLLLGTVGLPGFFLAPVHLPIGISFFTFHAISYVVDVYRGRNPVQRNPIDFGLYIALFAQLVAGPIVRYNDVADQFRNRTVTAEGFARGVRRFLVGLAKKMLIANTIAVSVDAAFALPPQAVTTSMAWLSAVGYILQLYFDFSGYSDMAIGLALMFGFRFKENFNYPYVAQSITDFWRRWHISLSTWFRDYLYIPLGGSRVGRGRQLANLMIVFFLCGLWHGASWNFLIWGVYHGLFLVAERLGLEALVQRMWRPLRHAYVLLVHTVGCVLVRAADLPQALAWLAAMAGVGAGTDVPHGAWTYLTNDCLLALLAGVVGSVPWLPYLAGVRDRWLAAGAPHFPGKRLVRAGVQFAEVGACVALLYASAVLLAAGTYNPFIYFRF